MTDGLLSEAIRDALLLEYPTLYVGLPQDNAAIPSPAVLLELQSDVVVGSPLQRGALIVHVCSQADDTTPEDHAAFAADIDASMRAITWTPAGVQLYGIVCQSTNLLREERHWRTAINYVLGYGPTP
jgi:hypothetical protein